MNPLEETIQLKQLNMTLGYIRANLPRAELLAQLAEEGAELTHAALKLRRVIDGTNPTPVSLTDAVNALQEEVADVLLLIGVLNLDRDEESIEETMERKLLRWAERLKGKEKPKNEH